MSIERLTQLMTTFRQQIASATVTTPPAGQSLPPEAARELLESMLLSRHLDAAALTLRMRGAGHYTIGSSGHEGNAVLGRLRGRAIPRWCTTAAERSSSNARGRSRAPTA